MKDFERNVNTLWLTREELEDHWRTKFAYLEHKEAKAEAKRIKEEQKLLKNNVQL